MGADDRVLAAEPTVLSAAQQAPGDGSRFRELPELQYGHQYCNLNHDGARLKY